AEIKLLRTPILAYIKEKYNRVLILEEETQAGEVYLDSLGVDPGQQGKGIGSKMLKFLIEMYVFSQHQTLGLLVDKHNQDAKRLYLKLGFKVVGDKYFAGKELEHLQINPEPANV
ncbi:MAG: GNAT family N-acetyltransferase, partial [Sphingobacteriales bacterium]